MFRLTNHFLSFDISLWQILYIMLIPMSTKPHIERIWCVCVMLIINNLENKSMRGTKHAYLEKYQLYQECMFKDPFHICRCQEIAYKS